MDVNYSVAVLGLGREGIDLLKFLNKQKIKPVGLDSRKANELGKNYKEIKQLTSKLWLGKDYLAHLAEFDMVFRSPGVPLDLDEIKKAQKQGVIFSSLTQLFFDLCPAKIVGVTGTKGKSTTSSLIYHILKKSIAGKVYLRGNIGEPPLALLPKLRKSDVVVLELSSFQLEDLSKSPSMAVFLNVVPEHLSRHKTFSKYLIAKSNIFLYQKKNDYLITSDDYPATRSVIKKSTAKVVKFSTRKILSRGIYLAGNEIILRDLKTGQRTVVLNKDDIPILGKHNLNNVMSAIAVAKLFKVPIKQIKDRIKTFKALSHRMELVTKFNNVEFINDSMATTPVAVVAAVEAIDNPLALILGGVSKGEDLNDLLPILKSNKLTGIVIIGKDTLKLTNFLNSKKTNIPFVKAKDLKIAIDKAIKYLPKDTKGSVILVPGFASFDMFKDAYDRGDQFKKIVCDIVKSKKVL